MNAYFRLMRLDKPIGIYLLLWPTLWALFLAADGWPRLDLLLIFTLGVVLMRSAGCVINDYADREIDKHIERTALRPITAGEISATSALKLFVALVVMAFLLVLMTNWLTVQLSFVAAFFATLYPFTKRWTHLPQFILGLAFAMSVPMAFSATHNALDPSIVWVFLATIVWTVVYDTMYAMADREEDLAIGVKSTAVLFAQYDRLIIGILQVLLVFLLINIGKSFNLSIFYDISVLISAILMIYHQFLIKNREKTACFKAFLHNHYLGMAIFLGIALSVLL